MKFFYYLFLAALVPVSGHARPDDSKAIQRVDAFYIEHTGRVTLVIMGKMAEKIYASPRAENFATPATKDARKVGDLICVEAAKVADYDSVMKSWLITIFGTVAPSDSTLGFLREIQKSKVVCSSELWF